MSRSEFSTAFAALVEEIGRKPVGAGDGSVEALVNGSLRLAIDIVLRYPRPPMVSHDDLTGPALEGLFLAAIGFRPERGYRFTTYAAVSIRRAISRYLVQTPYGPIRTPTKTRTAALGRQAARIRTGASANVDPDLLPDPDLTPLDRLILDEASADR